MGAIEDYCAASEANDLDGLARTLAPDAELVSPLSGRLLFRGNDDLRVVLDAVYGTLKDLRWGDVRSDGAMGFAIGRGRVAGLRIDDAMVFELAPDGLIRRIRPHLRPWLATTVLALLLGPKVGRHPGVVWRGARSG